MADNEVKVGSEVFRNAGIAAALAACVVFHVLVHDHWKVTAAAVWGNVVAFFSPASFLWSVVWVIGAGIAVIIVIYAVVKYTWVAPVWLDRTRLCLSLALIIWLWTGSNAQRTMDSWVGVWSAGHWQALAVFLVDVVLFAMVELSFLKILLPYAKKMDREDWAVIQGLFGVLFFLGGVIAPLGFGAGSVHAEAEKAQQIAEANAAHTLEVFKQKAPGWRVEKFDKGFAWIAPSRKMGKPLPTEVAAWKEAVELCKAQPALNRANPEGLPPHYKLQITEDTGSNRMYRPLIPNGKCDISFSNKGTAVDTAWAFYYRDHNGAKLEEWP